jgi:hypothetical protein
MSGAAFVRHKRAGVLAELRRVRIRLTAPSEALQGWDGDVRCDFAQPPEFRDFSTHTAQSIVRYTSACRVTALKLEPLSRLS